jgi:hypothetical protein
VIGNNVYLSGNNEALYCQVVLGGPQAQLVCPVDGNGGNAVVNDDDWYVGATQPDRPGRSDFTANLIPVVWWVDLRDGRALRRSHGMLTIDLLTFERSSFPHWLQRLKSDTGVLVVLVAEDEQGDGSVKSREWRLLHDYILLSHCPCSL